MIRSGLHVNDQQPAARWNSYDAANVKMEIVRPPTPCYACLRRGDFLAHPATDLVCSLTYLPLLKYLEAAVGQEEREHHLPDL